MALIRRLVHLTCCTVFLLFTQFANANGVVVECSESANSALSAELKALVSEIAETTEIEVRRLLPDLPEEILLSVTTGPNVIPEIGIGASSLAPGHIEFVVNPGHPDGAEAIVRANLRSTLFHEMHHLTRGWVISGGEPVTSFMDAVVGEGMATVFEKEFAGSNPLWGNYSDEASEWVEELMALPLSAYDSYAQWMFYHPDGRRWIGYLTGTYLVEQVVAKTGRSSAELVRTPTHEIIELLNQ